MPRRGGGQWDPRVVKNAPRYQIRVPRKGRFFDFHYMTIDNVNYTQVLVSIFLCVHRTRTCTACTRKLSRV